MSHELTPIDNEKQIHVRIQQIYGKKRVTTITGIEDEIIVKIFKELRRKLSCGGHLSKDKKVVQLQGDYSSSICDVLGKMLGDVKIVVHGRK
ncbi:Translation initiation factor 1 (eIF-1/SUI1) [Trachipleistophora hominis]|uniref:Translation initiation factor 1 (EIF-1/SUI1) n=1 Tax=Trachipleistophora hominis TaxID=72359 RepID=L7JTV3_TRAHO|nr:Translation initiation factor 1 (eIF-1/SUI1) [Trachipleistophora hominis]